MRSLFVRPAVDAVKVLAAGALVAAGAAGCTLSDAKAADVWTAVTSADAKFRCNSHNCNAGGVGPVSILNWVGPKDRNDGSDYVGYIGSWERTVAISCKYDESGSEDYTLYQGEVRDNNWTGTWLVYGMDIPQAIDDSRIPAC